MNTCETKVVTKCDLIPVNQQKLVFCIQMDTQTD